MIVNILKLKPNALIPKYQTKGSSGADVHAYLEEPYYLMPGEWALIPTGLAFEIPRGYEAQVRSRSGLALKGISVLNSPGTIDSDFTEEVKVILKNSGDKMWTIEPEQRIAQLVFAPVAKALLVETQELLKTSREGGFGSTGI